MAEQRTTAPEFTPPARYEAAPLQTGARFDLHASSEHVSSWQQGHELAKKAVELNQYEAQANLSGPERQLSPEVAYLKQATQLIPRYRQLEQQAPAETHLTAAPLPTRRDEFGLSA